MIRRGVVFLALVCLPLAGAQGAWPFDAVADDLPADQPAPAEALRVEDGRGFFGRSWSALTERYEQLSASVTRVQRELDRLAVLLEHVNRVARHRALRVGALLFLTGLASFVVAQITGMPRPWPLLLGQALASTWWAAAARVVGHGYDGDVLTWGAGAALGALGLAEVGRGWLRRRRSAG